jgi:hypothetical protein
MKHSYHAYRYNKSLLMTIPSVHHHTAFAEQVNNICHDQHHRPDAVAVELGHSLVLELVSFLRELKQGEPEKNSLPCMLGIMRRNRFIHKDKYENSLLLQKLYRSPLYNIPDDILAARLNFSKWATLFISPADSIIEAVRCAIELNIPVYGVDLNDFASTKIENFSIEDPASAHNDLQEYGNRVMKYCGAGRDMHIDYNREMFMASGLKYCLTRHLKVLFICGMAHWQSILTLMDDEHLVPFPVHEIPGESEFRRVIVHPSLAAPVMEILPQITFDYEMARQPAVSPINKSRLLKPEIRVRSCLDSVYHEYTSFSESSGFTRSGSAAWSKICIYEQYLFNLSVVRQRKIPDMATLLISAKAMMDNNFGRLLTQKMMEVTPEWASSKDFPGLPLIQQVSSTNSVSNPRYKNKKIRFEAKNHDCCREDCNDEINFFSSEPDNMNIDPSDINEYWEWKWNKKEKYFLPREGNPWIWPPCESLIYGIAFKAAEISNINQKQKHDSSAFDGSLEGGINVKSTIRSLIHGERKIYVSKLASGQDHAIQDGINPDPFVLIFPENSDLSSSKWSFFTAGSELEHFVKDCELFDRIRSEKGDIFVSSILFEENIAPPPHLKLLVSEMSRTHGTVMFGNPCINSKQSAIWLESTDYKSCPILSDYGMRTILAYYYDHYNLKINLSDWKGALIRMAIPFAKKMVTIIASDSYCIPEEVKKEASGKRVQLNLVGYSNFSESQLDEARHRYSIRTLDRAGIMFPPETEVLLGQTIDTYFDMLPYAMRKQVGTINTMNDKK